MLAEALVCQRTRRATLSLPEYNGISDVVDRSFQKASEMYGDTRAHKSVVSVESLNL
jgi:hypothetical protein